MSSLYLRFGSRGLNQRNLAAAAQRLAAGGVAVVPTDTNYVLACPLGNRDDIERIRRLRGLDNGHMFTFLGCGFSELGTYAIVDNNHFRMLKQLVPGPFVFVMKAKRTVPKAFALPKRRTIGFRVPDHPVLLGLIEMLGKPMLSCTLHLPPSGSQPASVISGSEKWLAQAADVVIDAGELAGGETTVVDLANGPLSLLREGRGLDRLEGYRNA